MDAFIKLLQDPEPEVRTVASSKVACTQRRACRCMRAPVSDDVVVVFSEHLDRSLIMTKVMPVVRDLASDASQYVRAALATAVMGLSKFINRDDFYDSILPLFLLLLRKEDVDFRVRATEPAI